MTNTPTSEEPCETSTDHARLTVPSEAIDETRGRADATSPKEAHDFTSFLAKAAFYLVSILMMMVGTWALIMHTWFLA